MQGRRAGREGEAGRHDDLVGGSEKQSKGGLPGRMRGCKEAGELERYRIRLAGRMNWWEGARSKAEAGWQAG